MVGFYAVLFGNILKRLVVVIAYTLGSGIRISLNFFDRNIFCFLGDKFAGLIAVYIVVLFTAIRY